jgi:ABC-type branched-subunit amino acid transport system substrate-binding protein
MYRSKRTSWWGALASAAALTLLTAACGGTAATGGDPIKVMLLGQIEAPDFAFPELEPMARAAIDPINAAGGIGGRQVELEVCNDQRDANKAGACARQAVSDEVDLVIGPFSLYGGSILPILEQAGIAYTGNTILSPDDGTNPVSFPITGGTPAGGAAIGVQLVERGCTEAGAIGYDNAASNAYINFVDQGLKSGGGSIVTQARVAPGTPDYAPALATVVAGGAECIFVSLPPNESAKLLSALAQSPTRPLLGSSVTSIPQSVISRVAPEVVEGTVLIGTSFAWSDDVEPMRRMTAEAMAAGVPVETIRASYSVQAWSAATIAMDVLEGVEVEINSGSVLEAMGRIDQPASGPLGAFSTAEEFSVPGLNRLFNRNTLAYTVHDGAIKLDSPEWHDVSSVLAGIPG